MNPAGRLLAVLTAGLWLTALAAPASLAEISVSLPGWSTERPAIRVAVRAEREVVVSSQSKGPVRRLTVIDGAHFQKGEVLMELDCDILKFQVDRAEALARRQNLIKESNERLARMNSKSALEVNISKAEAEAAAAEAGAMRQMLEQCRLIAPFDGQVGTILVKADQYVVEGQPLMELLDLQKLTLEFIVPSDWIVWFRPGHQFTFTVDETGGVYQAVLTHLGGRVDPVSQSIKAYADLTSAGLDLTVGMSGTAELAAPARPAEDPRQQ